MDDKEFQSQLLFRINDPMLGVAIFEAKIELRESLVLIQYPSSSDFTWHKLCVTKHREDLEHMASELLGTRMRLSV